MMDIKAKHFPFDTSAVSKKQFDEHMKLYKGYVDKTNQITNKLSTGGELPGANATYSPYRGLKKGETYAIDGVILHEAYFQNMTETKTLPGPLTARIFHDTFGGYEAWKEDMVACGKAARGWSVLVYEQRTGCFRNILLDLHDDGLICMAFPLIVMDMYEHAYFLDYGTDKEKYIHRFIDSINWEVIEKRVQKL